MISYSPLRYPGGKGQMYDFVLEILEHNDLINCTYIEPFCGGAGVAMRLLFEKKVKKVIINDYDPAIYAFWKSIITYNEEFIKMINEVNINMDTWRKQKEIQKNKSNFNIDKKSDILILGFSTFFLNRTNRSGIINAGVIGGKNQTGNYLMDCRFNKNKLIDLIQKIGQHSDKIEIYNEDAIYFLDKVGTRLRNVFYFIDPPYYVKGKELYTNSLLHDDHVNIEKVITKRLKNKRWIVTYDKCNEIEDIYSKYKPKIKELRYSLANKMKQNEFLFTHNISLKEQNDTR